MKSKGGFTIIETLVAITILMIAIAGPLTVANQAYHAALDARNQMIASNLAQETVEEVRNYKDNNIQGSSLSAIVANFANPTGQNVAYANSAGSYTFDSCSTGGGSQSCQLYLDQYGNYTYSSAGGITPFQRWFTVTPVDGNPNNQNESEYLLTVTVQWVSNTLTNQIQIQDILSNANR